MSDPYAIPKHFNIAGPCIPAEHYMLDAIARLPEARTLAENKHYFVIHAPRQSGKTTLLKSLTREIEAEGKFYALYSSLETLQGVSDAAEGVNGILASLRLSARKSSMPAIGASWPESVFPATNTLINETLTYLSAALDKPLILFFDEADCLSGQALISFLRQLRDGYVNRDTAPFPWSISLIGMRDIRDFKSQVRPDRDTLGSASPFNIVTKALTLGNFTPE
ncbi:MAG: ATP-binding protein, partial [Deltaproteobacteria bacterium]|nr:ATP-binding protein [Deltaproteobacteria bacterium]